MKYLLLFLIAAAGCSSDDSNKNIQECNCSTVVQSNIFTVSQGQEIPPADWQTQSTSYYGSDCAKDGTQLYYNSTSESTGNSGSGQTTFRQFRHIVICNN